MGSNQSVLQDKGYTVMSEQDDKILVKNKGGDQFVVKKLRAHENDVSNFLQRLSHPHIVEHKEIITDHDCLYLVMELCEGGDLAQKIKDKKEKNVKFFVKKTTGTQGDQTNGANALNCQWTDQVMENNQILDWTVKICMALKHLHDQGILHKNLQPKSIFFTACGTIRLGVLGAIDEWFTDAQTAKKAFSYDALEKSKPDDEKSEIWSLGCIISEMCKCAFTGRSTAEIHNSSYEALPGTFSEDLRQLVRDTLQKDPAKRPSVSEILMRPFIIKHLYQTSTQTIEELNGSLKVLDELANSLETVHYNTTVGSLAGGVVGLAGGITSIVGLILTPVTLGASVIVTAVGVGVGVAGGVASGVSNLTKVVKQRSNRQNIKIIITDLQEKIASVISCIHNIQIAVETQTMLFESNESLSDTQFRANDGADEGVDALVQLGRGVGGISAFTRLSQFARFGRAAAETAGSSAGRAAAQAARVARVAEVATGVLAGFFVAVDVFFIALDSKEIHNLRKDYASTNQTEQELRSEIMKFVTKIRETKEELKEILDELKVELQKLRPQIPN